MVGLSLNSMDRFLEDLGMSDDCFVSQTDTDGLKEESALDYQNKTGTNDGGVLD